MDLGIEVILALFSKKGLEDLFNASSKKVSKSSENAQRIYSLREEYCRVVNPTILFLQGKLPSLARQICTGNFLPEASRFHQLADFDWAFGTMGMQDKAKHLATLFLEDLSDFIVECVDDHFGFSRYAERLGKSPSSFDELYNTLKKQPTYIDEISWNILKEKIVNNSPKLVCFSIPFPGNLYSAFRSAQFIKFHFPAIKIAFGGGYANTELRSVNDVRVFEFFDFITLDDGELPIELISYNVLNNIGLDDYDFKRTFRLIKGKVTYLNTSKKLDYKQSEVGTPDYHDLLLDQYISVIEVTNPMHSLWSDGRWNKLTMAHGCYWGKCTFCDVSLDYIKIYEPVAAKLLVDRVEELIAQTGETGFHFVDEAAPPSLMKAFALELIKRQVIITWWTNIRFEKNFTQDICYVLAASGCIAVSGGLEVASDRLLALIDKGVTVEQVAQVTRNFTNSGIMVHAYLMYGYPTQTIQETIDSLEMVRQLFQEGVLQSGFWHQFALTAHSPIGLNPEEFGVIPKKVTSTFAHNDLDFEDKTGIDHNQFSFGLKKSLYNYMHSIGFENSLQSWFDFAIPKTTIPDDYILKCIEKEAFRDLKSSSKVYWLGSLPKVTKYDVVQNKQKVTYTKLTFEDKRETFELHLTENMGDFLIHILPKLSPKNDINVTFGAFKNSFEPIGNFELFWNSETVETLRENGLLVL